MKKIGFLLLVLGAVLFLIGAYFKINSEFYGNYFLIASMLPTPIAFIFLALSRKKK